MKFRLSSLIAWQPFTPPVFLAGVGIALAALAILAASFLHGQHKAAQAKVDAEMGRARSQSTSEAMATVERANAFQDQSEALSRENENAIRQAPGADQPLPYDLNRAARERLCHREAYRRLPECAVFNARPR